MKPLTSVFKTLFTPVCVKTLCTFLLVLALPWVVASGAQAQVELRIEELSPLDREFMARQRATIENLAALKLGRRINGDTQNDLQILQLLLDRRIVRANQTQELQAMGVIMGDLLASDLDMQWVVYIDALGRSRALRYKNTEEYLFPITMISRRIEVGNDTPVAVIYENAYSIIDPLRQDLPFR
ncbi:MAG: DUF3806 domain-containing protein [Pseudomonadota bacterium]